MEITIESNTKISDLQHAFNMTYPFLKMEATVELKNGAMQLLMPGGEKASPFVLKIDRTITIESLEKELLKQFQIPFQVMRRSGPHWIGTSLTKDWTLEHQNKEGELLSREHGFF